MLVYARTRRTALAISLAALALSGCPAAESHADIGMSDSTFVHLMVRLRRVAADTVLDSLARDSARRSALRQQQVTVEQLEAAARALADQPTRAETLWKTIDAQLRPSAPTGPNAVH